MAANRRIELVTQRHQLSSSLQSATFGIQMSGLQSSTFGIPLSSSLQISTHPYPACRVRRLVGISPPGGHFTTRQPVCSTRACRVRRLPGFKCMISAEFDVC